jgi:hypothetical protein
MPIILAAWLPVIFPISTQVITSTLLISFIVHGDIITGEFMVTLLLVIHIEN